MDRSQTGIRRQSPVDPLPQAFTTPGTRRAALRALLGMALLHRSSSEVGAKGRRRKPGRRGAEATASAVTPLAVSAQAKPEAVTITVVAQRGEDGTFSTSGAFVDAGTVTTEPRFSAGGAPEFLIIHATDVFTSPLGSFTLKRQVKVTPSDDPNREGISTGTGTWVVLRGTGAYERLHGQGTVTLVLDETVDPAQFTFTFTGHVQL